MWNSIVVASRRSMSTTMHICGPRQLTRIGLVPPCSLTQGTIRCTIARLTDGEARAPRQDAAVPPLAPGHNSQHKLLHSLMAKHEGPSRMPLHLPLQPGQALELYHSLMAKREGPSRMPPYQRDTTTHTLRASVICSRCSRRPPAAASPSSS